MGNRIKRVIKSFFDILKKPEMQILPGQIAFYFLMSFIPILALFSLILGLVTENLNLISIINDNVPDVLGNILINFIDGAKNGGSFLILLFCYMLVGSNGPSSIIIASNTLYGVKNSNQIKLKIKSFLMLLIIVLLLLFMLFVPIGGDVLIKYVLKLLDNPEFLYKLKPLYSLLKIFFSFLFIFISIKVLFTMAPDIKIKSKETTWGALFTTISWIIATEGFAFYITKIADYNKLYGNFASILILLMWVYLLAYLFVIGMAMNINKHKNKEIIEDSLGSAV